MTARGAGTEGGRRLTYRGCLRFPYGFHTGDGRRVDLADQPLFREPDGRIALAGTSLAGVLRADLRRLLAAAGPADGECTRQRDCACPLCRLMGPEPPEHRGPRREDKSLRASRLHVSGGCSAQRPEVRIRDHVGIDRRTRTAADRRKYDVEVAERGLELPFELRIDAPNDQDRSYLEAALRRLADGWWFLGGKTASGLGRVDLVDLVRQELDLGDPESLVAYLLADEPDDLGKTAVLVTEGAEGAWAPEWPWPESAEGAEEWAQLRLHLEIEFPWDFLVNAPVEGLFTGTDHAFSRRADGRPFLPGSALRGALRSRGEQILRTLARDREAHTLERGASYAAACDLNRKDHSCHERIKQDERPGESIGFEAELQRHCLACRVFGSGRLASGVKITDFHPVPDAAGNPGGGSGADDDAADAASAGNAGNARTQEFVAIDRFTGGAAEGAKFDAQVAESVALRGEIHLEISRDRLQPWGLGLVALVLRDLLAGDVPIGFGTTKGLNEYRVRVAGADRFWLRPPRALAGVGLDESPGTRGWSASAGIGGADPRAPREDLGEPLAMRSAEWVEALHAEVRRLLAEPDEGERMERTGPKQPARERDEARSAGGDTESEGEGR